MTPHKEKVKEPINKIILWPTFHAQWEDNSTYQISFTAIDIGSELYDELDVESHFILDGQEYVAKSCVENIDTNTKEILAWHIYNEIDRLMVRSDLDTPKTTAEDGKDAQTPSYSIEDVLKKWLDNNQLGFTYEIHGNFEKKPIENLSGNGKEMLSKIVELWPSVTVFPDNKNIRIYDESEFSKDTGRVLDFPHDLKSLKTTRDSRTIINQIRCIGGKHTVEISTGSGTGGNLDDVNGFCKSSINADFGVNKDSMCQDFANRSQRVNAWGVDVNKLYDTVKNAGVSPEWFFAYELQEQGTYYGWLNHTYKHGDAYQDAQSVCEWIKSTSQSDTINPAWSAPEGSMTPDANLAAKWNQEFGKGSIGRVYLQGTAAATWDLAGVTPNPRIGKPVTGCVNTIRGWGGHTNSGGGSLGWPFPSVGEGNFSGGQLFGVNAGGEFRMNGFHDGLDFGSVDHPGTDVHAVHGGKVTKKSWGGNEILWYVVITDDSGLSVEYQEAFSNAGDILVNEGDSVTTGQVIGHRNTSHLHIGITRHSFPEAFSHAFSNDGTWLEPKQTIESGIAAGGSDNSGSYTTRMEVYYFQPFILEDEESIKEWGPQPGPDFVDESFHDAESMRQAGLKKLNPNPDLTIELGLKGNNFNPKAGEILRVQARNKKYAGSWRTVAYDFYPRANNQDTQLTLNKTKQTILNYQAQRVNQIQSALNDQTARLKGMANSLDKQSQSLTQVVNNNKENNNDKHMQLDDDQLKRQRELAYGKGSENV